MVRGVYIRAASELPHLVVGREQPPSDNNVKVHHPMAATAALLAPGTVVAAHSAYAYVQYDGQR